MNFFSSSVITTVTLFNSELISLFVMSIHKSQFLLMQVCVLDSARSNKLKGFWQSILKGEGGGGSQGTGSDPAQLSHWLMREQDDVTGVNYISS